MKKNLAQILAVAPIFTSLTTKHYSNFSLSYKIARAAKELEQHREFYAAEERKIVETYAVKDEKGQVKIIEGNRISFENQENAMKFNEEITKLQKTEVDIFEPFEIKTSDFRKGELNITPQEIMALEDFVIFKDEEDPIVNKEA